MTMSTLEMDGDIRIYIKKYVVSSQLLVREHILSRDYPIVLGVTAAY